ncbi:hypothetical protein MMM127_15090 [Helicobacter pylori]
MKKQDLKNQKQAIKINQAKINQKPIKTKEITNKTKERKAQSFKTKQKKFFYQVILLAFNKRILKAFL